MCLRIFLFSLFIYISIISDKCFIVCLYTCYSCMCGQVLSVIAKYVNNLREGEGQVNEKLRLKLLELFGRLTSKVSFTI